MPTIVFKKQWADLQGRLWTYPVLAFCLLLADRGFSWCGAVAVFMALDLATQTAGDDARHGTFEFIFTRAIDRRAYLRTKFWFGPPLLVAFVLLVAGLEAAGIREAFWNLVMEPTGAIAPPRAFTPDLVVLASSALVLIFALVFSLVVAATSESAFVGLNVMGLIACGGYLLALAVLGPTLLGLPDLPTEALLAEPRFVWAASGALLVPAIILYLASRELYARRSLPTAMPRGDARAGATGWIVLIILIILALVVLMYLLLGHTAVEPALVPAEGG